MREALRRFVWLVCLTGAVAAWAAQPEQDPAVPPVEAVEQPAAEQPAPTPPARTSPSLAELVDREIARVEAHGAKLAAIDTALQESRDEGVRLREEALARVAELAGELQIRAARSAEIRAIYDGIVTELAQARRSLDDALDRAGDPSEVDRFEPGFDTAGLDVRTLGDRLARLEAARRGIEELHRVVAQREETLRRETVEGWGAIAGRLNRARIQAIAKLPASDRRQVMGLGRLGVEQLRHEIDDLRVSARLYRHRRVAQLDALPGRLLDVFAIGSATWKLVKIVAALAIFVFLRRRGPQIRSAAYKYARQGFNTVAGQRRAELLVRLVEVPAPWGLFLGLIAAVRWSLGPLAGVAEIDLLLRIATVYGLYRLAIDVVYAVTLRVVRRYRLAVDAKRRSKVLGTVRTMMRVVVGIIVMLILFERLVGRGNLYFLVVRFAWIFVLGAAVLLLARWRVAIADAYLGLGAGGRLTTIVARSRDRWYGVFVSAAAFVLLAGRAVFQIGRDFAMGFDQTRRALAFLFRRRVQKHAEQLGYADVSLEELPPQLVVNLAEAPVDASTAAIEHYPGLDRLQAMIGPWFEQDVGASFLLTGEKGMGKTSWLHRIDPGEVRIDHISLTHRVRSDSLLAKALAKELNLELEPDAGLAAVHKALLTGPKRIVTMDLAQNLFLGMVGGYDTFESFVSLVEATCGRVFWVCSMSAFAWDHLAAVRPDLIVFRDQQALTAWSEDLLGKMLRARVAAAGVEVVYEDLLLLPHSARDPARRVETAEQYTRLLWDYSDGNPRVTLHFWLRSLVPESEGRLRVRLFRAPDATELDNLGNKSRFLLAALVVHENLSLQEAADATRYPKAVCRLHLERLFDKGILRQASGRYRLTTHWHRAVVRFLKRGNLLAD